MIRSDERDRAGEQGALSAKAGKLLLDQKTHCINTLPTSTTVTGQTYGNRYFFGLLPPLRRTALVLSSACCRTPRTLRKSGYQRTSPR